jgi:hypothetical protein
MAHYAVLNSNNVVVHVMTGVDESDTSTLPSSFSSWEDFYSKTKGGKVLRCSYNTRFGQHVTGGTPYRGNYPGVGSIYDEDNDIFIDPQPAASWTKDVDNAKWLPPISYPTDDSKTYHWDESVYQADTSDPKTQGWVEDTE